MWHLGYTEEVSAAALTQSYGVSQRAASQQEPLYRVQRVLTEEPKWKGLSRLEQIRLLNAAQTLRVRTGRGTDQGLRDHALIATLLGTGLRVSELLTIDVDQYDQRGFVNVLRKGGHVQRFIPIGVTAPRRAS